MKVLGKGICKIFIEEKEEEYEEDIKFRFPEY